MSGVDHQLYWQLPMVSYLTDRSILTAVAAWRAARRYSTFTIAILGSAMAMLALPANAGQPKSETNLTEQASRRSNARTGRALVATTSSKRSASAAETSNPALLARLGQTISMQWDQVPFRSALEDLASSGRFDFLLDRRVDPDRLFSSGIQNLSIGQGLEQLAMAEHLGVSRLGGLVYVGPEAAAARLRTVAALRGAEVQRLPLDTRQRWSTIATWNWPRFSAPRELIQHLAEEAGIAIDGLQRVPHDLWPAGQLPPLSVADRLSLLANEFDLTYRLQGNGLKAELVPIPESNQITRRYPGGSDAEQLADEWRERSPGAKIKVQGPQILVAGRVEDHERLQKPTAAPAPVAQSAPDPSLVRNRLEIKSIPLAAVIDGLSQKLKLKVVMDRTALEAHGISFDQPISVDVKDATIAEVWKAVLEPTGLDFELEGDELRIKSKGK